jgi:hypothetical protein
VPRASATLKIAIRPKLLSTGPMLINFLLHNILRGLFLKIRQKVTGYPYFESITQFPDGVWKYIHRIWIIFSMKRTLVYKQPQDPWRSIN